MNQTFPILALTTWLAAVTAPAAAEPLKFESTDRQTRLVELYTSEGCSSCPPADRWLSTLRNDDGLWTDFVPLAFHVTYWNYLGWRDAFSDAAYDQRQRRRAALADSGVYTPGVFLDGAEYRSWRARRAAPMPPDAADAGRLSVTIRDGQVHVRYAASAPVDDLSLEFALLSSGLKSKVRAGENRGRSLAHDFVVADLSRHALTGEDQIFETTFALPTVDDASEPAVAAWVVDARGTPLQATGGWLSD